MGNTRGLQEAADRFTSFRWRGSRKGGEVCSLQPASASFDAISNLEGYGECEPTSINCAQTQTQREVKTSIIVFPST